MSDETLETIEKLWDYYYSPTMAAKDNFLCHWVNGKEFTEAVNSGETPVCNVTDAVLVASGLPYNDETVTINSQLWARRRNKQIHSITGGW